MNTLIKANIIRMTKHIFFIPGLILAVAITYLGMHTAVAVRGTDIEIAQYWQKLAALGIPAFFSLFIPLFVGGEYKDGAIRNKAIAGHKQSSVYMAEFIAVASGVALMWMCWLLGGISFVLINGGALTSAFFSDGIAILGCNLFYASIITALAMRIRRMEISVIISIIFFMFSYFAGVTVFALNMMKEANIVTGIIENVFPLGQWFGIMNCDECVPTVVRILIALAMTVIFTFIGNFRINERELV